MQLLEGWCDPYLRGGLDLWQQSLECGGSPELIIGPGATSAGTAGALGLGSGACGRVDQWQLAFFDQHLRGQQRPKQPSCWAYDLPATSGAERPAAEPELHRAQQQWARRQPQR